MFCQCPSPPPPLSLRFSSSAACSSWSRSQQPVRRSPAVAERDERCFIIKCVDNGVAVKSKFLHEMIYAMLNERRLILSLRSFPVKLRHVSHRECTRWFSSDNSTKSISDVIEWCSFWKTWKSFRPDLIERGWNRKHHCVADVSRGQRLLFNVKSNGIRALYRLGTKTIFSKRFACSITNKLGTLDYHFVDISPITAHPYFVETVDTR